MGFSALQAQRYPVHQPARRLGVRPLCCRVRCDMSKDSPPAPPSPPLANTAPPALTSQETAEFLRIVLDAMAIQRHYHLFLWLRGSLQTFLPHQVLLSAVGDFSAWELKLDIVSALPSVNTRQLAYDSIEGLIEVAHAQWVRGGRRPVFLGSSELRAALPEDPSPLHRTLRSMTSTLVHGVHDFREGHDSLYILQDRSPPGDAASERLAVFLDLLIPQIDVAFRRVAALPLGIRRGKGPTARTRGT